jgi:MOSC domain-containing protein
MWVVRWKFEEPAEVGNSRSSGRQKAPKTMENPQGRVKAIYRYPIKGLSPQPLPRTSLAVGATLPADRLYAIENGPSGFDPGAPAYFPKQRFLMLMRNERLAALRTDYDEATHCLTIHWEGREAARGDLRTKEGRLAIEAFFRRYMPRELRGPPKVLSGAGHSFSDVAKKVVSIINLASVAEVESTAGAPVQPLRFRGNVYVSGWPAWHEFELLGTEITIGASARLKVVKRIQRCAATEVDPNTGIRDVPVPRTLMHNFGHADCGIYAEVISAGGIAVGDRISAS